MRRGNENEEKEKKEKEKGEGGRESFDVLVKCYVMEASF